MRPIWTGSISFGLINIPVKIFSAVQESNLDLDMLDSKDHSVPGKGANIEKIIKSSAVKK